MKVKLFATLKERAAAGEIEVAMAADTLTVAELREAVARQYPALAPLAPLALVAVNQEFAFNADPVLPADEVAMFPPVSGGADYPEVLRITPDPIDLNALQQAVTTDLDGAVVIFTGTVRGHTLSGAGSTGVTTKLEYEAYTEMALAKLRQVAAEMRARWGASTASRWCSEWGRCRWASRRSPWLSAPAIGATGHSRRRATASTG